MSEEEGMMSDLRTMYELPYVMHFVSVNKDKFSFPAIDIEVRAALHLCHFCSSCLTV